jgi:glutaredoxin 3
MTESTTELFGSAECPHTRDLREHLQWQGIAFTEYDVEADAHARDRMLQLTKGQRMVPVLVRDGHVASIGWHGRGCLIGADPSTP